MKLKTIKNSALKHGGEFNNGFLIMPEGKLEAFTNSLFGIKASGKVNLADMAPEARVEYFNKVTVGYCKICGYEQPYGRTCQCWNDE